MLHAAVQLDSSTSSAGLRAVHVDQSYQAQQKHWLERAGWLLQALVAARRQKPKKTKQRSDKERVKPSIVKGVLHWAAGVLCFPVVLCGAHDCLLCIWPFGRERMVEIPSVLVLTSVIVHCCRCQDWTGLSEMQPMQVR